MEISRRSMSRERWESIQVGEFDYHLRKDATKLLERNLPYWRSLIASLPDEIRFASETRVIDLGCGACSIILALDTGVLVGVDPLMDRYLRKFPYLSERSDIRWVTSTAEEVDVDESYDVVFMINALDHVYDPTQVASRIRTIVRPGGHCVLTMNCHNTRLFRAYYASLYRLIDQHHPFQFTPDQVTRMFEGFTPVDVRPIDDLWLQYAEAYYRDVLGRPFRDRRKLWRAALNPLKWPMGFCTLLLDMPPHAKRLGQRSIYSNYLFALRRDAS